METRIVIPQGWFETFGTGTLVGTVMNQCGGNTPLSEVKKVTLVFQQSPMGWRAKNQGPHISLVPEYAPMCFAQDILWLVKRGIEIEIAEETKAPQ